MDWKSKYPEWVTKAGGLNSCAPQKIKQEVFIERSRERHGDTYDYSNSVYTAALEKVTITCKLHGDFEQTAAKHMTTGQGCPICAGNKLKTTEKFIADAVSIHGDRYTYNNSKYKNDMSKVIITCQYHGDFEQTASDHLQGKGCMACSNRRQSNIVYILTEGTDNYKIGVTCDIKERKRRLENSCGFDLKLVAHKELSTEQEARELESKLHSLDYSNPYSEASFSGHTEWRTINQHDLELLITYNGFTVAP